MITREQALAPYSRQRHASAIRGESSDGDGNPATHSRRDAARWPPARWAETLMEEAVPHTGLRRCVRALLLAILAIAIPSARPAAAVGRAVVLDCVEIDAALRDLVFLRETIDQAASSVDNCDAALSPIPQN
jgi:hypothetical protein